MVGYRGVAAKALWLVLCVGCLLQVAALGSPAEREAIDGRWIWSAPPRGKAAEAQPYNQTVIARKRFRLREPASGVFAGSMKITADSWYRLSVNGSWVNDGPSRAWPEHYQFDELQVGPYLKAGQNEIEIVARYFGVGDFHRIPRRPGLIAELQVAGGEGDPGVHVSTDGTWEIAEAPQWVRNTPKVSIQMEPAEWYDARLEEGLTFRRAQVLFTGSGEAPPWKLVPRDTSLLTREPVSLRSFLGAKVVKAQGWDYCLPAARLANPGVIEANIHGSAAGGMATILETERGCTVRTQNENMEVAIDGKRPQNGAFTLKAGRHVVLAMVRNVFGHDKEKSLRFLEPSGFKLVNPLQANHENPWAYVRFKEFAIAKQDMAWGPWENEDVDIRRVNTAYPAESRRLLDAIKTPDDLASQRGRMELMPSDRMFVNDAYWQFRQRQVVPNAEPKVHRPSALMTDSPSLTVVEPDPRGDVELLYDLGKQYVGYLDFDLQAEAGVAVDLFEVEYITPNGTIQFSDGNRNGMRYITKKGNNRFTSLKRRSGRFLFVTLRNQKAPVAIRNLRVIESTYPVNQVGSFACSDTRLEKIWEISTHTLKLCMEDTFTDCPLYEQTHWVGDARNESLLAYPVFGAQDLARHCIKITAQSLERYPIAGCQTPSGWDVLIPNWAWLWGISVWDHYWYTGDPESVREFWPAVIKNLQGAEKYVTDQDLFSAPWWNFFDWTPLDQNQKTVLHNSLILIGAIDAALKLESVVGDESHHAWLMGFRAKLAGGVRRLWNSEKQAFPDALRADGSPSPVTSQHTTFLAVLYDVIGADQPGARRNMLNPPPGMVKVGSPFAALYLYDAMEKAGLEDDIVKEIYRNYVPMLEAGATSVWESFPSGTLGGGTFPTRSHAHAWSSAPNYFLPRLILGVKQTSPGAKTITLSPRLSGLTYAHGVVNTVQGPVNVAWKLDGNQLHVTCTGPSSVKVVFARNDSLQGKTVVYNGVQQ